MAKKENEFVAANWVIEWIKTDYAKANPSSPHKPGSHDYYKDISNYLEKKYGLKMQAGLINSLLNKDKVNKSVFDAMDALSNEDARFSNVKTLFYLKPPKRLFKPSQFFKELFDGKDVELPRGVESFKDYRKNHPNRLHEKTPNQFAEYLQTIISKSSKVKLVHQVASKLVASKLKDDEGVSLKIFEELSEGFKVSITKLLDVEITYPFPENLAQILVDGSVFGYYVDNDRKGNGKLDWFRETWGPVKFNQARSTPSNQCLEFQVTNPHGTCFECTGFLNIEYNKFTMLGVSEKETFSATFHHFYEGKLVGYWCGLDHVARTFHNYPSVIAFQSNLNPHELSDCAKIYKKVSSEIP